MYEKLSSLSGILCVAALVLLLAAGVSDILGLLLLGYLLFGMMMLVIVLANYLRRRENEKNPITTVEATVVGHRLETYHGRYSASHSYYVTFKPEDGSDALEFKVSENEYQDLVVGDKGPLRYRTWEYLSFRQKDMSAIEPLSPLPDEYEPSPDEIPVEVDWSGVEKWLTAAKRKASALWTKLTERMQSTEARKEAEKTAEKSEEDDGIFLHELDE